MLPREYQHREEIGTEVRYDHEECGDSRGRLYVKRIPIGYYYFCHNCGFKGVARAGRLTPQETIKAVEKLQENQVVAPEDVKLPDDFTTDIPDKGLAWLYKYGITDEEISKFSLGYAPSLARLILPVYGDSELVYWQGRALEPDQKPKYLNVRVRGKDTFFIQSSISFSDASLFRSCVIVEDILSAIKTGRITNAIALLGSYIPDSLLRILNTYDHIYVWLDSDKRKESIKYSQRIQVLTGKPTKTIYTELDPKCYTEEEIKEVLNVLRPA